MLSESNILVTGGTSPLGVELIRQLLACSPNKIVVFTRNESAQDAIPYRLDDERLSFCIGDIRDLESVVLASNGIDTMFHLAELKNPPICEKQPIEALRTNVLGTQNVIRAAMQEGVKMVIYMSGYEETDPANLYSLTKGIGETLMLLSNRGNSKTKFICVRGSMPEVAELMVQAARTVRESEE